MSEEFAIRINNIGKQYQLGHVVSFKRTLRETLTAIPGLFAKRSKSIFDPADPQSLNKNGAEHFWALQNINLEIRQGEVVGIIGRNGAGKSTLLKILSRITPPTTGSCDIQGRIVSLLEVGTGFHQELTGSENIYLNGAILGMSRIEIDQKYDDIVAFSEIEKFIDTPVKRYSSGMRVRLAFSIAAHLEPEILLIDEVLSVGDIEFRRKCLSKMEDIADTGRTVLFVSHNLATIRDLCERGILLDQGEMVMDGSAADVVDFYMKQSLESAGSSCVDLQNWQGDHKTVGTSKIIAMRTLSASGEPASEFGLNDPFDLAVDLAGISSHGFILVVAIENSRGVRVYHLRSQDFDLDTSNQNERCTLLISIPQLKIVEGDYLISAWLRTSTNILEDTVSRALSFRVKNRQADDRQWPAVINEKGVWKIVETEKA